MKIRLASDLHLEAYSGRDVDTLVIDFLPRDDRDEESVLVLAGDISSSSNQLIAFVAAASKRFRHTIVVGGNHEVYKQNFQSWNLDMAQRYSELPNVTAARLDEIRCITYDGVRFVFGTLWADGGPTLADRARVGYYLNDFQLIRWEMRRFTVSDMVELNKHAKSQIKNFLSTPFEGPTVVVTHHLPSRRCVSPRFLAYDGSDGANGGFASDCDSILASDEAPNLWLHGHTHDFIDTMLWKTRVVCNPTGYRGEYGNGMSGGSPVFLDV